MGQSAATGSGGSVPATERQVLYVAGSSQASPTGGGRTRILRAAQEAEAQGYKVHLVCFYPLHHVVTRRRWLREGLARLRRETDAAVTYFPRLPLRRLAPVQWLSDWMCSLALLVVCRSHRIRLLHGHGIGPALLGLNAGSLDARLRVVVDVHGDVVSERMHESGLAQPDAECRSLARWEERVLRSAAGVVFVSRWMHRYYEKKWGITFSNSAVIPCAVSSARSLAPGASAEAKRALGLSERLVVTYVGSAEAYQMPLEMCSVFRSIYSERPDALFLIISHNEREFRRHLMEAGLPTGCWRIQPSEPSGVFDLLRSADIGLLLRDDSIVNRVASPNKFAEYCACGVPVLTTPFVGDMSSMVTQYNVGHVIEPGAIAMTDGLRRFIDSVQADRDGYAARCSQLVQEEFLWSGYGSELAGVYGRSLA